MVSESPTSRDVFDGLSPEVRSRTKKMLMYFIVFAIVMLFAGFTSAYIVSSMGQYWVHVIPGTALWVSNGLIVASSATLWWAVRQMRAGAKQLSLFALALTLMLGIGFTLSQSAGWKSLSSQGMGWNISNHESGMQAYRWNNIESLIEGDAVYGQDFEILRSGRTLLFDPVKKELYAPDDELMVRPITREVKRTSNSSGAYLWALISVHILHLVFGFIYLIVNTIRVMTGVIHSGDVVRLESLSVYWHFMGALWLYLFAFLFFLH